MIGAIIGDVVGSIYEFDNIKTKNFPLFKEDSIYTDDTICTVALADCLINDGDPVKYLQEYCVKFEHEMTSYGGMFKDWIRYKKPEPYYSYGNGAAMRISSIAFALDDWESIQKKTIEFTEITHNHPYGIAGALCVSEAIHLGKTATDKKYLIELMLKYYPTFDITETVDSLRKYYKFNETCQGTVPQAILCVIESTDFEDAIRNAISIGGDSDTLACIAGGIAQSYYKVIPDWIINETLMRIPVPFHDVFQKFQEKYDRRII